MKIVVVACDIYADIAPAFKYFFLKHWPKCMYEVEYVTNSKDLGLGPKSPVFYLPGRDINFGWRLREYLHKHFRDPDGLLLILMIDYLVHGVNKDLIAECRELCLRDDVMHCRLKPMPHPQHGFEGNKRVGRIEKGSRYCISMQPGIWNAKFLRDVCRDSESPYHTETFGSARASRGHEGTLLSTKETALGHHNYYLRKRAQPWAISWVMKNAPKTVWPDAAKGRAKK